MPVNYSEAFGPTIPFRVPGCRITDSEPHLSRYLGLSGCHTSTYKGKRVGAVGSAIIGISTATISTTPVVQTVIRISVITYAAGYSDEGSDPESIHDLGNRVVHESEEAVAGVVENAQPRLGNLVCIFVSRLHNLFPRFFAFLLDKHFDHNTP